MRIVEHESATAFLARAESWLLESEAEHNLLLGLAGRLREGDHNYEDPIFLATVEEAGEVRGCAWRTPPWNLGFTRLPAEAVTLLAETVGALYDTLPGLHGPKEVAAPLATLWAAGHGVVAKTAMRLRIFQLEAVAPLESPASGTQRPATERDHALLTGWAGRFQDEASPGGARSVDMGAVVERLTRTGALHVWEDGDVVSMAAAVAPTAHGIRVNLVYTPPELRRRGYASACVAAVSQRQLDAGRRFCFLYTDLANPTSNSIYRKIGYRPIRDVVDVEFLPGEESDQPATGS